MILALSAAESSFQQRGQGIELTVKRNWAACINFPDVSKRETVH